jgi:Tol biopolymer transport system component
LKGGRTRAAATRSSSEAPTAPSPTSRRAITTSARACTSTAAALTSSRSRSIYYSNFADQRIYRIVGRATPQPITPEGKWFYADAAIDDRRQRLVCVREDHSKAGHEPVTTLVSIKLDGAPEAGEVIASGYDFYSTPRLSPDGTRLAWLSWRHPQMPWGRHRAVMASMDRRGHTGGSDAHRRWPHESIYQPGWSPDGTLYFSSDRTGWWSLYKCDVRSVKCEVEPVLCQPLDEAEFGRPQWLFGWATWAFADERHMAATYARRGRWTLATIDTERER